jgi:hypothetical protein
MCRGIYLVGDSLIFQILTTLYPVTQRASFVQDAFFWIKVI